ncbi:hypothetical protein SCLCIDRAFT_114565, partial [Scleroderma citrinum Foug A]
LCHNCLHALQCNSLPKLALSNHMWIGKIPPELEMLTLPEQLLIARYYPRCYIFKLFPKGECSYNPNHLQHGMAGNVSLYNMNTDAVVVMLEGQMLPQCPSKLASVIAVTYIGTKKLPKSWLKSTFQVRRHVVHDALIWLKRHNPIYHEVTISNERLDSLPIDDIPWEILSTIRHEPDGEIVQKESAGYVPVEVEGIVL